MRGRRNSIILRPDNEANDIIISPPPGTTVLILNILMPGDLSHRQQGSQKQCLLPLWWVLGLILSDEEWEGRWECLGEIHQRFHKYWHCHCHIYDTLNILQYSQSLILVGGNCEVRRNNYSQCSALSTQLKLWFVLRTVGFAAVPTPRSGAGGAEYTNKQSNKWSTDQQGEISIPSGLSSGHGKRIFNILFLIE